jgi:hypothetical protein
MRHFHRYLPFGRPGTTNGQLRPLSGRHVDQADNCCIRNEHPPQAIILYYINYQGVINGQGLGG